MKKKVLSVVLASAMVLSMTGCGSSTQETTAAATEAATQATSQAGEEKAEAGADTASGETYVVGICQLVQHDALDAATLGFKDALTEALGDAVTFDEQNAQGDPNTCSTIINSSFSTQRAAYVANRDPFSLSKVLTALIRPIVPMEIKSSASSSDP